jgi:hypothetical protein
MAVTSLLSTDQILLYVLIQFLVYFGPGYLLLQRQVNTFPFVVKLPMYISVGMLLVTIVLSVIGIFYIWDYSLIAIGMTSYALIIVKVLLRGRRSTVDKLLSTIRSHFGLSSIIPICLFSFIIGIFAYISGYLGWPQPGDAFVHGFLTNLLVNNQILQTTLDPVAPLALWASPFGFHVVAANLSIVFDIFPGASIHVLAITIMILSLMLIYCLTYILSRSVLISLLASLSGFYISSIFNMEYWLIGYYYNGIYPCLFGYLAILAYLTSQFYARIANNVKASTYWPSSLISLSGIAIIYPPFAILPAIHFVGTNVFVKKKFGDKIFSLTALTARYRINRQIQNRRRTPIFSRIRKRELTKYALYSTAGVIIILIIVYVLPAVWNSQISQLTYSISRMVLRVEQVSFQFSLTAETFFASSTDAGLTFLTMAVAVIAIVKRKLVYLASSYLLFSVALLLSVWDATANYFWFILPRRLFVFLIIFNWITILTYARIFTNYLVSRLVISESRSSRTKFLERSIRPIMVFVLIALPPAIIFLPDLFSNAQLIEADRWVGWFSRSLIFENDYNLLAWISENINSKDLIMVQNSYGTSILHSMAIKNVTSSVLGLPEPEQKIQVAFDNQIAWERPQLLKEFVERYNVKYVLLLSAPVSWGYSNPIILGGDTLLHIQKYNLQGYSSIFSNMSFLEPEKTFGSSVLYRVNSDD